jgi:hypothetical protein
MAVSVWTIGAVSALAMPRRPLAKENDTVVVADGAGSCSVAA